MLNSLARASVSKVTDPIGRALLRAGLSPDLVTVHRHGRRASPGRSRCSRPVTCSGDAWSSRSSCWLDLVDGAMARARGYGTDFGVVLDASCDRIADGALFGALAYYAFTSDQRVLGIAALICLVTGQVISYVKARADSVQPEDRRRARRAGRAQRARPGRRRPGRARRAATPSMSACGCWPSPALVTVVQRLVQVRRAAVQGLRRDAADRGTGRPAL